MHMLFWHRVTVWFAMNPPLRFISTIFFKPVIVDFVNYKQYICVRFTVSQITLFSNFFIKNGSHNTIYTFKNYFTTVFSVSVFNFSKNKLNPNTPRNAKHITLSQYLSCSRYKLWLEHHSKQWHESTVLSSNVPIKIYHCGWW